MKHQESATVRHGMNEFVANSDQSHRDDFTDYWFPQKVIMIARRQEDSCASMSHFAKPAQDPGVDGKPSPLSTKFPPVDKVADKIKLLGFDGFEKSQKRICLRMPTTQMNIADKHRPD